MINRATFPRTTERVALSTPEGLNARIRHQIEASVDKMASAEPGQIDRRLAELDEEWDVERVIGAVAPTGTLLWLLVGLRVNRKLLAIPILIQGFVLFHALEGWLPPLALFRWLGFRTSAEIDHERNALKALRGDFRQVSSPAEAVEAARR
jgi:hypothetical protein